MTEQEMKEWFEKTKVYHPNLYNLNAQNYNDSYINTTSFWEDMYQAFKRRIQS